jgi:D-alanine-D-alanine ligase
MKALILHNRVSEQSLPDEKDVLEQIAAVSASLRELGHQVETMAFDLDLDRVKEDLRSKAPDFVFNLVEGVDGKGCLTYLSPALLYAMQIPFTGSPTEAIFNSANKMLAKQMMHLASIPTPPWVTYASLAYCDGSKNEKYIVKSVWEHASIGLDDGSIIAGGDAAVISQSMQKRRDLLGGDCFAEQFIDGREFNLSLLAGTQGPQLLAQAEMQFLDYPAGKPRVVGYKAKWEEESFEYKHTVRTFQFKESDMELLDELTTLALQCWHLFGLRGYGRVDFRVDREGRPWVLEVNTNPCLSKDAGFAAALQQSGFSYTQAIERIVADASRGRRPPTVKTAAKAPLSISYREEPVAKDAQCVREIIASSGFFSKGEIDVAVELVEERLNKGKASGYYFLFAELDGRVVGYTCFGPIACTEKSFDLYWIAIHNDLRGRGLGKELLARSEATIAQMGGSRIYLETSSKPLYEPTRAFYLQTGYHIETSLEDFYAPGDGKVIFLKKVS